MTSLSSDLILKAYQKGIFPMAEARDSDLIRWVRPDYRGAVFTHNAYIPRNLRKFVRGMPYQVTVSEDFRAVMLACAEETATRDDTWINEDILEAYCGLADLGFAHSVEVWDDQRLVGGLYGVHIAGAFFGESMFSRETNTSKAAMVALLSCLSASGIVLLDTQFWTPHLAQFGVDEVPNEEFQIWLSEALTINAKFVRATSKEELASYIASTTSS